MRTWSREPLVGFLLVGVVVFGVDLALDPPRADAREVHVSADDVRALAEREAVRLGHALDAETTRRLVQAQIDEEVLARFGMSLGLHEGDPIVRRRVVQQVQLLADASVEEPTDEQLASFLEAHAEGYRREARWRLELRRYDDVSAAEAARATGEVDAGARPLAFGNRLGWRSASEVARMLGDAALSQLQTSDCADWCGPVTSPHGPVLLRVDASEAAAVPPFEVLRPRLRQRWLDDARLRARAARTAEVRLGYDIVVDWPAELDDSVVLAAP